MLIAASELDPVADAMSLDFLRVVYRDPDQLTSRRMRLRSPHQRLSIPRFPSTPTSTPALPIERGRMMEAQMMEVQGKRAVIDARPAKADQRQKP
ncbi:MAG TPA: hypothetical protein VNS33_08735 [Bradyrhizobium sp.]|nr:hypothetical protein [Bradyrhizobium sp.]